MSRQFRLRTAPGTQRIFWSKYARIYNLIWDSPLSSAIGVEVAERLCPHGAILEIGCGTGLVTKHLAASGRDVAALDVESEMLARVPRSDTVTILRADASRLPLADASMANVVLANVLHTVEDPLTVLRDGSRGTAPGGRIVLSWPVDHLHPSFLSETERRLGRSILGAAGANLLRIAIGAPGLLIGARRWLTADLHRYLDQVSGEADWHLLDSCVVLGTVHLRAYATQHGDVLHDDDRFRFEFGHGGGQPSFGT